VRRGWGVLLQRQINESLQTERAIIFNHCKPQNVTKKTQIGTEQMKQKSQNGIIMTILINSLKNRNVPMQEENESNEARTIHSSPQVRQLARDAEDKRLDAVEYYSS